MAESTIKKTINFVKKYTYVGTTDTDGDTIILNNISGRVFVSAIPNRTYGDGTYSGWFGVIVGRSSSNGLSVKCINDNIQKIVSQKVAIDVYYIE